MTYRLLIFRLLALVALALSSASLVDTLLSKGAFCGFRSGCGAVTASAYGRPLGIPLPVVGVVGFASLLFLSFVPARIARQTVRVIAAASGVIGIALILIQATVLERLCTICLLIDGASIALAIAGVILPSTVDRPKLYWLQCAGWALAGVLVVATPPIWGLLTMNRPPPAQVTALWVAGKINVVELTDFDCHYCASAEQTIGHALHGVDNIHFVRIPAPMPKHANARPSARAFLAAKQMGKGEETASALFAAKSRSAEDCRKLARDLELDLTEFDRIVKDPALDAELDATLVWAQRAGPGLPMLWVQDYFFPKTPSLRELQQVLDRVPPHHHK